MVPPYLLHFLFPKRERRCDPGCPPDSDAVSVSGLYNIADTVSIACSHFNPAYLSCISGCRSNARFSRWGSTPLIVTVTQCCILFGYPFVEFCDNPREKGQGTPEGGFLSVPPEIGPCHPPDGLLKYIHSMNAACVSLSAPAAQIRLLPGMSNVSGCPVQGRIQEVS